MKSVKFSDYQEDIMKKIKALKDEGYFNDQDTDLIVSDNFTTMIGQNEVGAGLNLGGYIPVITVIGKQSGRLYNFSATTLIPEAFDDSSDKQSKAKNSNE